MSMRSRPSTDSFRQAFFPWHCYAHLLCDESPMKRDPYVATIVQRKPGDVATFAAVRRAQLGTSLLLMNLATFAAQATTQVRVVYTGGSAHCRPSEQHMSSGLSRSSSCSQPLVCSAGRSHAASAVSSAPSMKFAGIAVLTFSAPISVRAALSARNFEKRKFDEHFFTTTIRGSASCEPKFVAPEKRPPVQSPNSRRAL